MPLFLRKIKQLLNKLLPKEQIQSKQEMYTYIKFHLCQVGVNLRYWYKDKYSLAWRRQTQPIRGNTVHLEDV